MKIIFVILLLVWSGICLSQIKKTNDTIPDGFKTDFMIRDPFQNYMYGFNFSLPVECNVEINITDMNGNLIYFINENLGAGEFSFSVPKNLKVSSGTYYFILKAYAVFVNVSFEGKTKFLIIL